LCKIAYWEAQTAWDAQAHLGRRNVTAITFGGSLTSPQLAARGPPSTQVVVERERTVAKNPYNHGELRRRQQPDEQGELSSSGDSRFGLRVIAAPLAILLVGLILVVFNVLGLLGVFLIVGGAMGLVVTVTTAMLGR
jgi:hypothetical protein